MKYCAGYSPTLLPPSSPHPLLEPSLSPTLTTTRRIKLAFPITGRGPLHRTVLPIHRVDDAAKTQTRICVREGGWFIGHQRTLTPLYGRRNAATATGKKSLRVDLPAVRLAEEVEGGFAF